MLLLQQFATISILSFSATIALAVSEAQDFPIMGAGISLLRTQSSPASSAPPAVIAALPAALPANLKQEITAAAYYEARRVGLNPLLVLAVIEVESYFQKYTVSTAGARGLMQIMPFWVGHIGGGDAGINLFDVRTNIRFGCYILRHYLNMERGNLSKALGRYNGSRERPDYPNLVFAALGKWSHTIALADAGRADVAVAPPAAATAPHLLGVTMPAH
jgi:soluble lytic murein transglycosylase-like protein